jgi:uncharacterized protein (TIGR00661 family)
MRILYGVAGEGLGHSSRAKEVIPFLEKRGHKVLVVTYGQAYDALKNDFKCLKVEGIMPHYENGEINFGKTITEGLEVVWNNLAQSGEIKKKVESFKPDVCISDMEPVVPIIRRIYGLPLISFDNQHRLVFMKYKTPFRYWKEKEIAKRVVEGCVARADAFIVLSFTKGKLKTKEKVYVVDPSVREEVKKLKPKKGEEILVYISREVPGVVELLREFREEKFVVYGHHEAKKEGNLIFKKIGKEFVKDLANCKAVIGTAGFSLMAESLFLKKPFFAIPLKGQFEQTLNAILLKQEGYGDYSENPRKKDVKRFLATLPKYEKKLEGYKMNPDEALDVLEKILFLMGKQESVA